ncbi:MAG TPA: glycosyltransferase family 39 protein [Candidatus Acidoferrum sp.]|nr:glycosyltransferase family 39 protein [Candidatus Acidoferrum sp.]
MKRPPRALLIFTSVWFIAAAALGTRLLFAWNQQSKIPHAALAMLPFDQETGNIALALSQGHGYANLFRKDTGPTAWLAPIYPFLLSLIFRFFGALTLSSFFAAVLLNALLSAGATFPLYAIARRLAGVPVAAATSWVWVLFPAGVLLPFEWIWDTSFSVLLAVTLVWATLRLAESAKLALWIAYALLWVLALLTNPSLGIGLPFLFAWLIFRRGVGNQQTWKSAAIAVGLAALSCLPWTVRNYHYFHRFVPIRSSLPFELWIGNNDIFDEHAVRGIQRITRFEETRRYAQLGESAYLDEKWQLATSFIKDKPALFARLTGRRILATWFGTEHPLTDFRRTDSLLARTILVLNFLIILGTVGGISVLVTRKHPLTVPLMVFPILYPVVYYISHTSLRYRHPIDPFLILLTVYSLARLFRVILGRSAQPISPS